MTSPCSRMEARVWMPSLHGPQMEVARHPARFKVLNAGRRFGKSKLGAFLCVRCAAKGGYAWWVSPTYKMALMGWRELLRFARGMPGVVISRSDRALYFPGGGYVQIRSASDPDSLRGEGLNFVFLDEFAFMQSKVWTHALRPALADKKGKALFGSTPFGQNHFFALFQRGLSWGQPDGGEFKSFHFTSVDNPYFDPAELEAARLEMPDDAFRQEHLAEFLEDGAGVFRGIDALLDDGIQFGDRYGGSTHVIGWDPAKFVDFDVKVVLDLTRSEVRWIERSNRRPMIDQLKDLKALVKRFPGRVLMDTTRDETLWELTQAEGIYATPIRFNAQIKQTMVTSLQMAIENRRFRMPRKGSETAVGELKSFRYELGKNGHVRYSAPPGMHDDIVTGLGLCALGMGSQLVYTKGKDGKEKPHVLPILESQQEGWGSL